MKSNNIKNLTKVPERCVKIIDDLAGKAEIRIEITGEDMGRLPSYITLTYNEETGTRGIIIPSEWTELIKKKLPFTAYGFEKEHLEYARKLMEAGITQLELKRHYQDFGWVAKILKEDLDAQIEAAIKKGIGDERK